ncbi:MAG TPA: tRNA lysidine(34) synthetase TilS [Segetibacter sp.]
MNLQEKFIQQLKKTSSVQKQHKQLLAVSGGVDSVVLCDLMFAAGYDFIIAHCNFLLRGEESERDDLFVRSLADKYKKEIFVARFDTKEYATKNKLSTQVAARDLRYNWFKQLAFEEKRAVNIVTAHHADDNIETVAMNFFRGTGLKGLIGMDVTFKEIFRPLLNFRKSEILAYAKEKNLSFVEDSSNSSSNYTRNYFRNELIPAISKVFPNVEENILKNIQRLSEVEQVYNEAINQFKLKLIEYKGKEEHIAIIKLQKQKSFRTILWEIIKEKAFSAAQVDEVIKLMDADNGSFIESETHRIIKNRRWLIITESVKEEENLHLVITENDKIIRFAGTELEIKKSIPVEHFTISSDKKIGAFDAAEIHFPLLLRRWKQGDYFYPLGLNKKKKVSKFFIDQKLSKTDKEKIWVIEMNKKIIWVVGQRLDDRFKIEASTKEVLKITVK